MLPGATCGVPRQGGMRPNGHAARRPSSNPTGSRSKFVVRISSGGRRGGETSCWDRIRDSTLSCQPGRIVRWQPRTTTLVLRTIAGVTLVVAVFRCGEASVTSLRAHRLFTAVGATQTG